MWESIGEVDGTEHGDSTSWVTFCNEFAVSYIKTVLGEPPSNSELEIRWNEHDLGSYPTIGVTYSEYSLEPPFEYITKAELLLDKFNDSVRWYDLKEALYEDDEDDIK